MTSLHRVPRNQESETLYWLDLAKRILGGDIKPDEARRMLNSGTRYFEDSEAGDDRPALFAAGQGGRND
jgi:hypothetical protein